MIAGMMQYHARRFESPELQVEQAQALLSFLALRPAEDAYGLLIRSEAENLDQRRAHSVYHDELAECHPLYFREFVTRAAAHRLQYLGEADFFEMHAISEGSEIAAILSQLARDAIEKEQYLDFLKGRRFRQTLLCHAGIALQRQIPSAAVKEFWIARSHRPVEEGQKLPTEHPVARAIVTALDVT